MTNAAFEKLLPKGSERAPSQVYCPLTNISYCEFTEHNKQVSRDFFWKGGGGGRLATQYSTLNQVIIYAFKKYPMRFELELLKFFNFFPTLLPTVLCSFLTMDHLLF